MMFEANPYPQDSRLRVEAESLAAAGYEVEVIVPRAAGQRRRERLGAIQVTRFRYFDGSERGVPGFLVEYMLAAIAMHWHAVRVLLGGTAVLHLHNPPDIFFPAAALFRLVGRPVIFDHHDLVPEMVEVKFGQRFDRVARACERLSLMTASHVIATNESYRDVAVERGGKDPRSVTVVRYGASRAWLEVPPRHRGGELRDVRLIYVGAISAHDGVEGLAPILGELCARHPDLDPCLTIVGSGDSRPRVEAALRARGVAERVEFTGWVPIDRVRELVLDADVCVDPAPATGLNRLSTMVKLPEYLALGKPIVIYDLLESSRTIAEAGVLVPPGNAEAFADAIADLAREPERRLGLAGKARSRASEISWDRSERALLGAYAAALEHTG
jgi:glycosyltransferase involved in cell wall biosynthesis